MRLIPILVACGAAAYSGVEVTPATTTPAVKKPATTAKKRAPASPAVTPKQRAEAESAVQEHVAEARESGIINPAALISFFEQLARLLPTATTPLRILHFGDSHIAGDDWPAAVREKMQSRFGDGGAGYTLPGRPFPGYRRYDSKGTETSGWQTRGLLGRNGDGRYGLSGVALQTSKAGESVSFAAEGTTIEVFYWRQPGGGAFTVSEDHQELVRTSTDAELGPGYVKFTLSPGEHTLVLTTVDAAPVRIFGWTAEKTGGVTWEPMGINGAAADLILGWDEALWRSHVQHRDPALIVVAYGTNEARKTDWTESSYKTAFAEVLHRLRAAAPAAAILVLGPTDHLTRTSKGWQSHPGIDRIVTAQRAAALESGCAFWNVRAGMGGRNSMLQWVRAGLAQGDYVHFTTPGYRILGGTLYDLMMAQYDIFTAVRKQLLGKEANAAVQP